MANKPVKKKKKKTPKQKIDAARSQAIKREQEGLSQISAPTKKRKKIKKEKKEKPPKPDIGKYVSVLSKADRDARQKKKTIFQLLGVFLFAINLFLPSNISNIPNAVGSLFLCFNFAVVAVSVYVSYQGFKKYLIREEVDANDAPKKGFKKTTYIMFEVFLILYFLLLIEQSVIVYFARDVFSYIGLIAMAAALTFIILARDILYKANKDAIFVPPFNFHNNTGDESNEFYEEVNSNDSDGK